MGWGGEDWLLLVVLVEQTARQNNRFEVVPARDGVGLEVKIVRLGFDGIQRTDGPTFRGWAWHVVGSGGPTKGKGPRVGGGATRAAHFAIRVEKPDARLEVGLGAVDEILDVGGTRLKGVSDDCGRTTG